MQPFKKRHPLVRFIINTKWLLIKNLHGPRVLYLIVVIFLLIMLIQFMVSTTSVPQPETLKSVCQSVCDYQV